MNKYFIILYGKFASCKPPPPSPIPPSPWQCNHKGPEISNLANLQTLELSSNQLSSLPPEIGNLSDLISLVLSYNQLSDPIPAALSNLINLYQLHLHGNPDLTCWETQEALDWALELHYYDGPTNVCGL